MRSRTFVKLLAIFLSLIFLTAFLVEYSVRRVFQQSLETQIERDLLTKTRLVAAEAASLPSAGFAAYVSSRGKNAEARITIIDNAGVVLADSDADPAKMENHATRPEVAAALRGETGLARRTSATTHEPYLYASAPIPGGAVRLAYPLVEIDRAVTHAQRNLLLASLIVLPLVVLLAAWIAHSISTRLGRVASFADEIAQGNFAARIRDDSRDELSHAVLALNRTADRLKDSFQAEITSREKLEALLNSMQEAVIAVGPDRRVQWVNGRMARLIPGGVRLGIPLTEVSRDPELLKAVQKTLDDGAATQTRLQMVAPGRVFVALVAPVANEGAVVVLHEVTEIERAEKTRRDFIANVSHELRTPLTSIRGYAETVLDFELDASTREFVEIIRKNALRMVRLTEDLLVLARVESGEESLDLEEVSAERLVSGALEIFKETARIGGHSLATELKSTSKVIADPDKIQQVFSNLLGNAIKYSAAGSVITLGATDSADSVEFFVKDSGPGIASEHLPRLFERFYRVDKARSLESGGTGLGLAIVKHIVLKHGGSVRAESEVNRGSTFYFTLPVASAEAGTTPEASFPSTP
ncbi:MAG TPA: ATP-binding protein [Terriglobales bacterium]|nr:ATP-binding protein [Terriglobales bacterium]